MDVAIASCKELPEPDPDAEPLTRALTAAGVSSRVLAWDDPDEDWSLAPLTVLRSTWNYAQHREAFLDWAMKVAERSVLWNPLKVVRWNTYKGYLLDLERAGLPVVPTILLKRGSAATLVNVFDERPWDDLVIKPAVSAASFRTRRFARHQIADGEAHLRDLLGEGDVLVQQYLPSVEGYGERALVWIDGELTHAVRKSPRFEGQDESVSTEAVEISPEEAELAQAAVETVDGPLLYARIDVAPGAGDQPVLMELELVEPSLFFPQCPAALTRYVAGIRRRLDRR